MAADSTYVTTRHQPNGPHLAETGPTVNVGEGERLASVIGGGLLGIFGLSRGSLAGLGLAALGGALVYRGVTGHCGVYGALGINSAVRHGPATSVPAGAGVRLEKSVIINRSPHELYQFWRNLENLPRFMRHLHSVITLSDTRSRWMAKGPLGLRVRWEAEIINEKPDELIAWRSVEGSVVDNAGSVHFTRLPGDRGTGVRVNLKYDPPAGKFGATVAKLLGDNPEQQIEEDLRRFKQLMEAGEIATTLEKSGQRRF